MKQEKELTSISIRITPEERRTLKMAAAQLDTDIAAIIRSFIRELENGELCPCVTSADKHKRGPKPKAGDR